jgi:phage terminase large subunit-like protein
LLVGYEQYGMQADIEHIREKQQQINYHFNIKELGGKISKVDRIGKILPDFQNGKILLPRKLDFINYEGKLQNLVDIFIKEEYLTFPTSQHDDMLDALARIKDEELNIVFPRAEENEKDVDYMRYFNDSTRDSVTGY